ARRWLRGGTAPQADRAVASAAAPLQNNWPRRAWQRANLFVPLVGVATASVLFAYCSAPLPGRTNLIAPALGALNVPPQPALRWEAPFGATAGRTSFRVVISDGKTGAWVASGSTRALNFTPTTPLQPGHQYFWGVVACGPTRCGATGSTWSFWTASGVAPPVLMAPAEGEGGVSSSTPFRWQPAAADQPVTYEVSIYDGKSGGRVVERSTPEPSF